MARQRERAASMTIPPGPRISSVPTPNQATAPRHSATGVVSIDRTGLLSALARVAYPSEKTALCLVPQKILKIFH
jgi:hypothetical protein